MRYIKVLIWPVIIMSFCLGNVFFQEEQVDLKKEKFVPYDVGPKMISEFKIEYPDSAKSSGLEGNVLITAFITKDGKVKELKIKDGNAIFYESALKAVKDSKWEPALKDGNPVEVWVTIPVHFRLEKDK